MISTLVMFGTIFAIIYFIFIRSRNKRTLTSSTKSNSTLANVISVVGTIYFILALIGGIYLLANSQERIPGYFGYEKTTNPLIVGIGIAEIFSGFIILLVCLGISHIIYQNLSLLSTLEHIQINQEFNKLDRDSSQ